MLTLRLELFLVLIKDQNEDSRKRNTRTSFRSNSSYACVSEEENCRFHEREEREEEGDHNIYSLPLAYSPQIPLLSIPAYFSIYKTFVLTFSEAYILYSLIPYPKLPFMSFF